VSEATIRTAFGQVRFTYETDDDLKTALKLLPDQVAAITAASKAVVPRQVRLPKPGYEHVYRFTPDGVVELLHFPKVKTKLVCLAMFAYHPDSVDASTVQRVTGIANVGSVVLGQSANRKYFQKTDELYALTVEGTKLASESVPTAPAPAQEPTQE
jgi:hypothetical protein